MSTPQAPGLPAMPILYWVWRPQIQRTSGFVFLTLRQMESWEKPTRVPCDGGGLQKCRDIYYTIAQPPQPQAFAKKSNRPDRYAFLKDQGSLRSWSSVRSLAEHSLFGRLGPFKKFPGSVKFGAEPARGPPQRAGDCHEFRPP